MLDTRGIIKRTITLVGSIDMADRRQFGVSYFNQVSINEPLAPGEVVTSGYL